jgi:hypothetical protein
MARWGIGRQPAAPEHAPAAVNSDPTRPHAHLQPRQLHKQGHVIVAEAAERFGQHGELLQRGARDRQAAEQQPRRGGRELAAAQREAPEAPGRGERGRAACCWTAQRAPWSWAGYQAFEGRGAAARVKENAPVAQADSLQVCKLHARGIRGYLAALAQVQLQVLRAAQRFDGRGGRAGRGGGGSGGCAAMPRCLEPTPRPRTPPSSPAAGPGCRSQRAAPPLPRQRAPCSAAGRAAAGRAAPCACACARGMDRRAPSSEWPRLVQSPG